MVRLWCFAWLAWCFSRHFFRLEKYANFSNFIFLPGAIRCIFSVFKKEVGVVDGFSMTRVITIG
ncbi:hypothetical protein HDF14_000396 [Edaphobacter lichenicola]|jgi:hypothetical protein|uniref:Uncharacterized protein n=1 Tax=Tunturiibacter gelidiferens TaxID=3069689 RepID=A0A9X0QAJ2_9BACT|nr:hypothetical protein [Edaphobacter lichenicola]